jgi:SnoaL-like domain
MYRLFRLTRRTWPLLVVVLVITGVATAATRSQAGNDGSARNIADIVLIDQHQTRYSYEIDSRQPEAWADLWTEDGVFEEMWQDANGDLHPINGGAGCKMTGQAEIAQYLHLIFASVPMYLPRPAGPGAGHRIVDRLIDVNGDTATLSSRGGFQGFYWQYETTLVRTKSGPDGGWKFKRVLAILNLDYSAPHCNANGPVA